MIIIENQKEYGTIVTNSTIPLLVDFYADWCGPCKQLTPKLEDLEKKNNTIKFLKINVDNEDCSNICKLYEINSLPTIIFINNKLEESNLRVEGNNIIKIEENIKKLINNKLK
tara:strand:- start:366 stop:704 length:339 start_codon:yes stop_codon:yes gene_type:complete